MPRVFGGRIGDDRGVAARPRVVPGAEWGRIGSLHNGHAATGGSGSSDDAALCCP